jgi:hypothetical protein
MSKLEFLNKTFMLFFLIKGELRLRFELAKNIVILI